MLSQTAEHALRAVLFLAQWGQKAPVPAERVAAALGAPRNYLGKTLNALARAGLVEGVRGPAGGYRLLVDPAFTSVATVIGAVEEGSTRAVCLLGDRRCDCSNPCQAHATWVALSERTDALLAGTTLADLLGGEPSEAQGVPLSTRYPLRSAS